MWTEILLAAAIAAVFLVPALVRPTVGRGILGALFIGGSVFNLLYTLPNTPQSLLDLVSTAAFPPYREVIAYVVARNLGPALVVAVSTFELITGSLILWRGGRSRLGLVFAGGWCLGMLPVIPPAGAFVGLALTGTPGLAALLLARGNYHESVFTIVRRHLRKRLADRPQARLRLNRIWTTIPSRLIIVVHPFPALIVFLGLCALFPTVLHPWFLNWGATAVERTTTLPGDDAPPEAYFTRAISIDAPPSVVWPWLLAIGQDRAGFLSNDYLENLAGGDIHNADTLRPEWQQRAIDDKVPMSGETERKLAGDYTLLTVRILQPERVIGDIPGRFVLQPVGDSRTRLLLREPLAIPERAGYAWVVWDPMHFVMEQRLLQGIKERAEGRRLVVPILAVASQVGWTLASLGLLALFLSHRRWRPWLLLPVAPVLTSLWLTGDVNSGMAAFLAVGITVAGFLVWGWRWCAPYLLVAAAVALVLLLAPDSQSAFGLSFLALVVAVTLNRRTVLTRWIRGTVECSDAEGCAAGDAHCTEMRRTEAHTV